MSVLRKVPARAGLQWVLGSLLLLRHAPLALGKLGILWAAAVIALLSLSNSVDALKSVGPYLILMAAPLFMGGLLWAVREVDYGRRPQPFHLLAGVYGERPIHLLMVLLPQFVLSVMWLAVLMLCLGIEGLQDMLLAAVPLGAAAVFTGTLEPAQIEALLVPAPGGNLLLWLSWVGLFFGMSWLIFWVMLPLVMFENINGIRALHYSFLACGYNLGAMGVCVLSLGAVMGAVYIGLGHAIDMLSSILAPGLAILLAQLVLIAVFMPLVAGAMYAAWKHMLAPDDLPPPPLPRNLLEV